MGKKRTRDPSRAGGAGQVFFFGQMACAPRGPERRADFFFELVLALVARGRFSFSVKWLCAPRGRACGVEQFFLLVKWLLRSARARGREGCFESPLPTSGLHSPRNELRAARP